VERLSHQQARCSTNWLKPTPDARESRVRLGEIQETEQQAGLESESTQRQLEWQKNQLVQSQAEAGESESTQRRISDAQVEVENRSLEAQSKAKDISTKTKRDGCGRVAGTGLVLEHARGGGGAKCGKRECKKEERAKEIMRLDSRRVELIARLRGS